MDGLRKPVFNVVILKIIAQSFFKLKNGIATVLGNNYYSGLEEKFIDAAEGCPVEVIKYEED
jgi:ferredoxin